MSVTAAIIAGAATAAAAGTNAIAQGKLNRKNRRWQEKMYNKQVADRRADAEAQAQRQKDLAQWAYTNFDSPAAQRAAYAAAGVNPFVEGSSIQPAQVNSGSAQAAQGGDVPGSGPYQMNPMSALQSGASSIIQNAMLDRQMKNADADIALKDAQRIKTLAEAQGQTNENSLFEFARSAAESDALSKRFRAELDKVNAEFAQAFAEADLAQRKALLQEIWSRVKSNLAQAARTDADRLTIDTLRDLQAKALGAGISLTESQTSATQAQTGLTKAQTETENALRQGRVELTDAQADEVLSIAGLNNVKQDREKYETFLRLLDIDDASNGAEFAQRIIRQLLGRMNADLSDYKRKMLSDYLEKIWSNQKP
jgi:hypothetical protein